MNSIQHDAVVGTFSCLGAECPDTCCRGWDMPADKQQQALYQTHAPELLATIDATKSIMKRCGDAQTCNQLCEGKCTIHARYGAEFLSEGCYFYPRVLHAVDDRYVMSGMPSCPEMLRLMLQETKPFVRSPVTLPRQPLPRRGLVPEGWTAEAVQTLHDACMEIAGEDTLSPEEILLRLLQCADALGEGAVAHYPAALQALSGLAQDAETISQPSDGHAIYYALALTEAFGEPGISARLAGVMNVMEQQLDCKFDRASRQLSVGEKANTAYTHLRARWRMDAAAALAHTLRRWVQAQVAMTFFPFGGFADASYAERSAVFVQRFVTVRLALMCHVSPQGVPPDEETVLRVIQAIARLMDHLADAKLTRMIHRDSGWTNAARLRGLVVA